MTHRRPQSGATAANAGRLRIAAVTGCLLLAPQGSAAQTPAASDAAKAAVGQWEFSNADRDRSCTLTLRGTAAPGGLALDWERKCAELFPFTREATAWTVGAREAIQMLDRSGKTLLELTEVEGGLYEGERPGEGLLFMQSVAAGATERTAEQMAGDWAFVRGTGKPICTLTLVNDAAGPERLALRVKPGCDALVTRFAPAAWRMDRGQLVLMPKSGEPWRFEESDSMTWRRIPEGRQPLQLVRQ
jgi:Protease inhibitor Inh